MAITFNSVASGNADGDITFSLTVNSGANKILIVGVAIEDTAGAPTVTSVVFNGTETLTKVVASEVTFDAGDNRIVMYYLLDPTETTANVVVTLSAAPNRGANAGAIVINGAEQQAPEAAATDTGADSPIANLITTLTDGAWVIDCSANNSSNNDMTAGGSQTERYEELNDMRVNGSTAEKATAGDFTVAWTYSLARVWGSSALAFEIAVAGGQTLLPTAIGSEEAFGTQSINYKVAPSAIESLESFGTPQLDMRLTPSSVLTGEGFGTPTFLMKLLPTAIAGGEAFGTASVSAIQTIIASAIVSLEAFGTLVLECEISPYSVESEEVFGTPVLLQAQSLQLSAIASLEAFGEPNVRLVQSILPSSISSLEDFGDPKLNLTLIMEGIASEEIFGSIIVGSSQILYPSAIASLEMFGVANISRIIQKAIAEVMGVREFTLRSERTYSGGKDIITRHLSSIWKDEAKKSTTWNVIKKVQKDE